MSVHPCGTPAGMMMMSPVLTARLTMSDPAMRPLHDGPFSSLVTALSGADLLPLTIWPPVTRVPLPDTMTYPSVCESCVIPPGVAPGGGVLACSPQGVGVAAGARPVPAAAPPPPPARRPPAAAPPRAT